MGTTHVLSLSKKIKKSSSSRIGYIKHQDIRRPTPRQLVHHARDILLQHHRAHGDPVRVLERRDGGGAFSRGDFGGAVEAGAGDVVLA